MIKDANEIIEHLNSVLNTDIRTKKRTNNNAFARFIYYKIAREQTGLSLNEIGRQVNRNHATVINGLKKFEDALRVPYLKQIYETYSHQMPIKNKKIQDIVESLKELNEEQLETASIRIKAMINMIK